MKIREDPDDTIIEYVYHWLSINAFLNFNIPKLQKDITIQEIEILNVDKQLPSPTILKLHFETKPISTNRCNLFYDSYHMVVPAEQCQFSNEELIEITTRLSSYIFDNSHIISNVFDYATGSNVIVLNEKSIEYLFQNRLLDPICRLISPTNITGSNHVFYQTLKVLNPVKQSKKSQYEKFKVIPGITLVIGESRKPVVPIEIKLPNLKKYFYDFSSTFFETSTINNKMQNFKKVFSQSLYQTLFSCCDDGIISDYKNVFFYEILFEQYNDNQVAGIAEGNMIAKVPIKYKMISLKDTSLDNLTPSTILTAFILKHFLRQSRRSDRERKEHQNKCLTMLKNLAISPSLNRKFIKAFYTIQNQYVTFIKNSETDNASLRINSAEGILFKALTDKVICCPSDVFLKNVTTIIQGDKPN
ncbi:uncharacterized protein ASCRUDRAFT_81604 [Ascoidea rubescens DSM 1968]|uniref:Uncharacterized protein n=1 Tax=Ascoidea rubescens DSM 1968 TaxID=1344418 RepID=A0A1D2VET3_9ASCO|nr:hypothetical protein ASCRUDRAFT_81604 [Ascoidea rubescens DSM 1968]ODV60161.1 hypothetical protein ASCRUDRAFT_81604 [Ascoidea rubescens DSM 1968]